MSPKNYIVELCSLGLLLAVALLLGGLLDNYGWCLFAAACLYIAWSLRQLRRIQRWLAGDCNQPAPHSTGLWGAVTVDIYRMRRHSLKEPARQQAVDDYLQDSFASLDDAAVLIDLQGNIEWSNTAAEGLLGVCYPLDAGKPLLQLLQSEDFSDYLSQQDYSNSLDVISPHNKRLHLQCHVTLFGKGSCLLFARDVTHTIRLEKMRRDFVANVSHELRTPLTVINGYLETLSDHSEGVDAHWRRAVQQMLQQSRRMETLIKDLIMLSRLEFLPENPQQQQVAIAPMLGALKEEVLALTQQQRELDINCDDSLQLLGDAEELRSAFGNLMVNAAKYTEPGGRIEVSCFVQQGSMVLAVKDNGIGIEGKHLPRLSERFYRVDKSRSIDTGGTGLGLAIVKHILLRHQAELRIESEVGVGSVFSCVFPVSRLENSPHGR